MDMDVSGTPSYFNPRPREGGDVFVAALLTSLGISIHAPARGATPPPERFIADSCISIHAPARGATGITVISKIWTSISIHAPARGATSVL